MVSTEKITINLSVVDLGTIDLLVEEGFYVSRTDFIRHAIQSELGKQRQRIDDITIKKNYFVGVVTLNAHSLADYERRGTMLDIKAVGLLHIDNSVTADLAEDTIATIKVWGRLQVPDDVRERLTALGRIHR
jgi:Arc/MetJ-type ribon-helix-helix transcriptional regulator